MSEITFTFCDFNSKKDLNLIVNKIKRGFISEMGEISQEVPGRKGNIYQGTTYGAKKFEVDVTCKTDTEEQRVNWMHELSNLFVVSDEGEFPLIFSDDPDVTYYAHISDISDPERISSTNSWATFSISFICSEPLGHYTEREEKVTENPYIFTPEGKAETYPVFTCIPKANVNKVGLADDKGDYVYLSNGVNEDTQELPVNKEPIVFTDRMNNLNLWTKLSQSTVTFGLNGVVATGASFRSTQETMTPALKDGIPYFGESVDSKWYGACYQRFLPSSYSDFKIRVQMKFSNVYARAKSKMETYLLDPQGRRIGYIAIRDGDNSKAAQCIVQVGGVGGNSKTIYNGDGTLVKRKEVVIKKTVKVGTKTVKVKGKTKKEPVTKTISLPSDGDTSSFTEFYGYVELEKRGDTYSLKIMKLTDKGQAAWPTGIKRKWTDTKKVLSNQMNLAGLAVYGAKYNITEDKYTELKKYKNAWMYFCDIKINEIKSGGNTSIKESPVALKGEEVVINCDTRNCSVDGESKNNLLYIGSTFVKSEGAIPQTFAFSPSTDEADWYVYHVPKTN